MKKGWFSYIGYSSGFFLGLNLVYLKVKEYNNRNGQNFKELSITMDKMVNLREILLKQKRELERFSQKQYRYD